MTDPRILVSRSLLRQAAQHEWRRSRQHLSAHGRPRRWHVVAVASWHPAKRVPLCDHSTVFQVATSDVQWLAADRAPAGACPRCCAAVGLAP